MKNHIILFFTFITLFSGCKNNPNPEIVNVVEFPVGFMTAPKNTGTFYNLDSSEENIYFADPVSNKCIKTFTLDGTLIDSIPLQEAIKNIGTVDGISILHRDTILINSVITNQLVAINHKGKVWLKKDLNYILKTDDGNTYELSSSVLPNSQSNANELIFRSQFAENKLDEVENRVPKTRFDYLKYFYQKFIASPHLVKINDVFSEKPKVTFGTNSFYESLSDSLIVPIEVSFFKLVNNHIILFTNYSDEVFLINSENMKISESFKITSDFTAVGIKPPLFSPETFNELDFTMAKTKPFINQLFYNPNTQEYYVIVMHDISTINIEKEGLYRPFSVIVYDSAFKRKKEFNFPNQEHSGYQSILTKEGLMFAKNNNPQNSNHDDDEKTLYTIFNFSN